MWIFVFVPGILWAVTFIGEIVMDAVAQYREEHPSVGHLIGRDNRVGRYYNTRH